MQRERRTCSCSIWLSIRHCMLVFQISYITYYRTSTLINPYAAYIKSSEENSHKF